MNYTKYSTAKSLFLTGATGVLGGRLLLEMLLSTEATIYCLIRAESVIEGREKIHTMLAVYERDEEIAQHLWRVVPVPGNLTEDCFGLDQQSYDELASSMDLVYHSAASVNLLASFGALSPINIEGVRRVVDFCLSGHSPLVYVSSYSVVGDQLFEARNFGEHELDVGQGFDEMGYQETKYVAEKMVRAASEQGLVWSIVRPGNIWGDSQNGCYPLFATRVKGIYYEILKSLIETGYAYRSVEKFDISPVDYVAKATLHVGMHIDVTDEQTYHLTSPDPIDFDEFVSLLRQIGYTVRSIDEDEYFDAIYEDRLMRDGKPYRSSFTELLAIVISDECQAERCRWDTSNIRSLLDGTDITYPASALELMRCYCIYAISQGFIKTPGEQTPLAKIVQATEPNLFLQHLYDADLTDMEVVS